MSAYNIFSKEKRAELKDVPAKEMMKKVAELWKALEEDDKKKYQKKADEDKQRYQREAKEYADTTAKEE